MNNIVSDAIEGRRINFFTRNEKKRSCVKINFGISKNDSKISNNSISLGESKDFSSQIVCTIFEIFLLIYQTWFVFRIQYSEYCFHNTF